MFTQLTALKPTGSAACPALLIWTCNRQLLRAGDITAPLITSCAFLFGQHQTFLCAYYFHIKSSVQKEKITWNSQNFTALTIREKNIIGQRIAKSLQNRSIAVLTVLGGKHIACLSPPPPRNRKKYITRMTKDKTAAQSQTRVQASQLEFLPCIYSILFHIQFERQDIKIRLASKINGFSFSSYTSCSNNTSSGMQPPPPFNMFYHQVILVSYWIAFRDTAFTLTRRKKPKVKWFTFIRQNL